MKTVLLTLLFIGCVLMSPIFLITLAIHNTPITPGVIKGEIVKIHLYDTAVGELNKQIDASLEDGQSDDPLVILAPFVKKEITAPYIQGKTEKLIDDVNVWIGGGVTSPPVVSFSELKEKLIKKNKHMFDELQSAARQMETLQKQAVRESGDTGENANAPQIPAFNAGDIQKFLQSDFTIPVGQYLTGFKSFLKFSRYLLIISGGILAVNLFLILLSAPGLQSKLRWIGSTFLFIALWNIPGALMSAGSGVMITSILTQNMKGVAAAVVKPLVETIITPILLTYTRITGGVVIALSILSVGMIILSFIARPVEIVVPVVQKTKKK